MTALITYIGRIRSFDRTDWLVYVVWIGLMLGLLGSVTGFLFVGYFNDVEYPGYVWTIPVGIFIFVGAIAIDTIGHRTVYKEVLRKGESLVHQLTIFAGITSVVGLCLAYRHPDSMHAPVLVLILLSVLYSLVDEVLHWHRYLTKNSDVVEMWSHFFILLGHGIMIIAWWRWFRAGYPGVAETLRYM